MSHALERTCLMSGSPNFMTLAHRLRLQLESTVLLVGTLATARRCAAVCASCESIGGLGIESITRL